ncbi:peroxisome assembly protein (Peroxin-2) [Xanthoria parietina]
MTSVDLAAAQQRVLDRRQARALTSQARAQLRRSQYAFELSSRLPYPLDSWSQTGIGAWDTIKGRDGTRPAFRVGQVDAELLDEELLELLKIQVGGALKYFGSHLREEWSSEILLALRAALFKLSIWDHNASYGAALQNLQYTDARQTGPLLPTPTHWQKAWYGLLSVGGRYGWEKWNIWLADQEGSYDPLSPTIQSLSRISSAVSTAHSIAAFSSFIVFLVNGRYRTLLDRILRLRLASPANHLSRQVSFEYLNRQLVWHAFTEFLLFLLPLVGVSRWRRWLSRAWWKAKTLIKRGGDEDDRSSDGELSFLPERTCAICYQDQNPTSTAENEVLAVSGASGGVVGSAQTDITNPYEMIPCSCIYCFVCAISRLEATDGEGWSCLRCGLLVKECKPWTGDVLTAATTPKNKKSVSFSDDDDKDAENAA